MSSPHWIKYKLGEVPIPQDPDGTRHDAGPPFNAWSGEGVAIANVVDAGSGLAADYKALAAKGVDVRTRIALIRYGAQFRGDLAKRAQDHGASGVIFFDDPASPTGSLSGPAYPDGPYRPLGSVQRGALIEGVITIPTLPVNALVARRVLGNDLERHQPRALPPHRAHGRQAQRKALEHRRCAAGRSIPRTAW